MSTDSIPPSAAPLSAPGWRRAAWFLLWLVAALVSANFLVGVYGKYHVVDSDAYVMFVARHGWLWTHLAGGALAIVLGPIQFLTRWPRFRPRVHRWLGRVYFGGMIVGLTGAVGLIASSPAPMAIRVAFASTALAWSTTGLVGIIAIYRRREATHRRWMIRNYLVTLSPITFRMMLPAAIASGVMPSPTVIATLLWASWAVPLVVGEGVFRVVDRRARHRAAPA